MCRASLCRVVWNLGTVRILWLNVAALVFVLVFSAAAAGRNYDEYRLDGAELTKQEKWVLAQIEQKKVADLKEEFGEAKEPRRLRSRFLEKLAIGEFKGIKVSRETVEIKNAIIEEDFSLEDAEIPYSFGLYNCTFKKKVNFRDTYFKKILAIQDSEFYGPVIFERTRIKGVLGADGAKFYSEKERAEFTSMIVTQDAMFEGAEFHGPADFSQAQIKGVLGADGAKFYSEKEPAKFTSMKVAQDAKFRYAEFHGPADFSQAQISGLFLASGSKFFLKEHGDNFTVNFDNMKVANSAWFKEALFQRPVSFEMAEIGGELDATGAHFLNGVRFAAVIVGKRCIFNNARFHGPANFNSVRIEGNAFFRKAVFKGLVNFISADIGKSFEAEEARFEGQEKEQIATFNSFKIGGDASFNKAVFQGTVDFGAADIKGFLEAKEARFEGQKKEQTASFNAIKVEGSAFFTDAVFKGPCDFVRARIDGSLDAQRGMFESKDQEANFSSVKVGGDAFFESAVFWAPVHFSYADIGGNFEVQEAQFKHNGEIEGHKKGLGSSFFYLKLAGNALFNRATFEGPAEFGWASVGATFDATDAKFVGQVGFAEFKVGQKAIFDKAVFQGGVSFLRAEIGGVLTAIEAKFQGEETSFNSAKVNQNAILDKAEFIGPVDFMASEIGLQLRAARTKFYGMADFSYAKNIKNLFLSETVFKGSVLFKNSKIGELMLDRVNWPSAKEGYIDLDGMTYDGVSTTLPEADAVDRGVEKKREDKAEDYENMVKLLNLAKYGSQPYAQLEKYFTGIGCKDLADKVFVAGKRREWREAWSWGFWNWPVNMGKLILLDFGVRFGRSPSRAFLYGLGFIIMGILVFSQPGVLIREDESPLSDEGIEEAVTLTEAFWYSLDLLIPALSFGPENKYRVPSEAEVKWLNLFPAPVAFFFPGRFRDWLQDCRFPVLTYYYVHQLMGYVLLTIGLAAITGIIK